MLSLKMFCENYEVGYNNLISRKSTGLLPEFLFNNNQGVIYIDEKKLAKRHKFRNMVQKYCQNFYYVLSEHLNDKDIAKLICYNNQLDEASIYSFINEHLFKEVKYSYVCYKVNTRLWILFKVFRGIERRLKRKYKQFNPEDLLERRYKEK